MYGGQVVREARRRAGLTQTQLAERAGTTQSAIARLERGDAEPGFHRVVELVRAGGLDLRVGLVDDDDYEWSIAAMNMQLGPARRVRNLKSFLESVERARSALEGSATARTFEPDRIVAALERHRVRYVVVGGFAAIVHGSAHITTDLDVVPDPDLPNLERLADAIRELGSRIRPDAGSVPFQPTGHALAASASWSLTTRFGDLDITFEPAGTAGFADLRRDAVRLAIADGVKATIASLEDVVRSMEAAGRDKDRPSLPVLRRILEEQARGGRSGRTERRPRGGNPADRPV